MVVQDFQFKGTLGYLDFYDVSGFATHKAATDGGYGGDFAGSHVYVFGSDQGVFLNLFGIEVCDGNLVPENYPVTFNGLGRVNLGAMEFVFQFADLVLDYPLFFLGRMVFGVFGKVALGACRGDFGDDVWAVHLFKGIQFLAQAIIGLLAHGNSLNRHIYSRESNGLAIIKMTAIQPT